MRNEKREIKADDVQCRKCGAWHHFDWGHVCPPDAPQIAFLHGLTLNQCEALRGYMETHSLVSKAVVALRGDVYREISRKRKDNKYPQRERMLFIAKEAGAWGDGVRFALEAPEVVAMMAEIEEEPK